MNDQRTILHVSEIIGEGFHEWKAGQKILITTPTGSGKTTFIFDVLLPYAESQNKQIIYFCNRVALTRQLNAKGTTSPNLKVLTYQSVERRGFNHETTPLYDDSYIVFDEAHYILQDAEFNGCTDFWRNLLADQHNGNIFVFLTATPDELLLSLNTICDPRNLRSFNAGSHVGKLTRDLNDGLTEKKMLRSVECKATRTVTFPYLPYDYEKFDCFDNIQTRFTFYQLDEYDDNGRLRPAVYSLDSNIEKEKYRIANKYYSDENEFEKVDGELLSAATNEDGFIVYSEKPNYDYIKVKYFSVGKKALSPPACYTKYDTLIPLIVASPPSEKWLIFVNNKEDGALLSSKLNLEKNDLAFASFINASTKSQNTGPYAEIAKIGSFNSCQVLVTTSVIDNGIDIKDPDVKNVVISAIDKTAFLQMLGRKRLSDDAPLSTQQFNVFIMHHTIRELNYIQHQRMRKFEYIMQFNDRACSNILPTQNERFLSIFQNTTTGLQQLIKIDNLNVERQASRTSMLANYAINEAGLLKLIYDMNFLNSVLREIKAGDSNALLKRQLSWLGKEYDETAWVNYEQNFQAKASLIGKLKQQIKAGPFFESSLRDAFIFDCFVILENANLLSTAQKHELARIRKIQMQPGQSKLNNAFKYANIPYRIKTTQRVKNGQKTTCWKVVEIELLQESNNIPYRLK